ncbi:MAG TPA: hypothetical protein VJP85_05430 [Candidatus Baltobacteraceae bacterium]|nr:hypothetical protein [Candidatus Baltobacteraceae bacterium]
MSAWTWVLIGLCAAGVLLAIASCVPVIRLVLRLRSRVQNLQNARLFTSAQALQLQGNRLEHIAGKAAPEAARAKAAVETIRAGAATAGVPEISDALSAAGAQISQLIATLR